MPPKPDTNKPKQGNVRSDTKKDNKGREKAKPIPGLINLDDDWLYHSKK
jgi:hypothetical protein